MPTEFISTSWSEITLVVFVLFCIGTFLVAALRGRQYVRRSYIAMFFASLLVANLVGVYIFPFVHLHKFSETADEDFEYYEIQLADEDGQELMYTSHAASHFNPGQLQTVAEKIVTEYDDDEQAAAVEYLLRHADDHRHDVSEGQSIGDRLTFPDHNYDYAWDADELEQMGEFIGINIYHVNVDGSTGYENTTVDERTLEVSVMTEDR